VPAIAMQTTKEEVINLLMATFFSPSFVKLY
jgi:hypothetical protein